LVKKGARRNFYWQDPDLQFALAWEAKSYNESWAQRCLPKFKMNKALDFIKISKKKRDDEIEKEWQKRELKRTRIFAVILGTALVIPIFFGIFAWQQRNEARKERKEAEIQRKLALKMGEELKKQREEARQKTYDAKYNLAKVFEEKALHALDSGDYDEAWGNMTAALKQEIPNGRFHLRPDLVGALLNREVLSAAIHEPLAHFASLITESKAVSSLVFSPDVKTLASCSGDKTIRLWDTRTQKETAALRGHLSSVTSVAFSPDGMTLASGSGDKTIRLWDIQSQKVKATLKGHLEAVISVAFSPDGKTLASGSKDQTIRLWDLSIYVDFLKAGKPTPLFFTFTQGVEFFWGVKFDGLKYKAVQRPLDDKKFLPLLAAPAPGQSKFDQILEWAKKEVEEVEKIRR
jgi:hypothetical protein